MFCAMNTPKLKRFLVYTDIKKLILIKNLKILTVEKQEQAHSSIFA